MSPETWQGATPERPSDLYSLGILAYEALTGELPFDGDTPAELMRMHLSQKPRPPKELRPETPAWLSQILMSLLSKSPGGRPASARETIERVKRAMGGSEGFEMSGSGSRPLIAAQSSGSYPAVSDDDIESVAKASNHPQEKTAPRPAVTASGSYRAISGASGDRYLKAKFNPKPRTRSSRRRRRSKRRDDLRPVFVTLILVLGAVAIFAVWRLLG